MAAQGPSPGRWSQCVFTGTIVRNVRWALVGALLLGAFEPAQAATRHIDSAISSALNGNAPIAVLVRVTESDADRVAAELAANGHVVEARLPGALRVVLHPKHIDTVLAMPGVLGLSADARVVASGASKKTTSSLTTSKTTDSTTTTVCSFADWSISWHQWDSLFGALGLKWSPYKGAGVGVAIIDSGIDGSLADFSGRTTDFYDFTAGGRKTTPTDDYGHGTHVAGLIGASSSSFGGLAPKVTFVGLKVLDATGQGRTSDVIAALDACITSHATFNLLGLASWAAQLAANG